MDVPDAGTALDALERAGFDVEAGGAGFVRTVGQRRCFDEVGVRGWLASQVRMAYEVGLAPEAVTEFRAAVDTRLGELRRPDGSFDLTPTSASTPWCRPPLEAAGRGSPQPCLRSRRGGAHGRPGCCTPAPDGASSDETFSLSSIGCTGPEPMEPNVTARSGLASIGCTGPEPMEPR